MNVVSADATQLTIENVGMAIKTGAGKITVNFFDGDTVILPPRARSMIFIGGQGEYVPFTPGEPIKAGTKLLGVHVKQKVALAGQFIQIWQTAHTDTG